MHDPMTVAFEIRYPWRRRGWRNQTSKFLRNYREPFVTVWHKDPERKGDDDSCDWFGGRLPEQYASRVRDLVTNPDDNCTYFFGDGTNEYEALHRLFVIAGNVHRIIKPRSWWRHPRWHIWHWRIQCHPLQMFKRRAFSRCAGCHGRFTWGYSPFTGSWNGTGPRWFQSERDVYHRECMQGAQPVMQPAVGQ